MSKTTVERYEEVVKALASKPGVVGPAEGKGFGSGALKVKGRMFAFLSSKKRFVLKLPKERVSELAAAKTGRPFDPGHGRLMKEWLEVNEKAKANWVALAVEALAFVGGTRKKRK